MSYSPEILEILAKLEPHERNAFRARKSKYKKKGFGSDEAIEKALAKVLKLTDSRETLVDCQEKLQTSAEQRTCLSTYSREPTFDQIRREVEHLKALAELPSQEEIVSDAKIFLFRKSDHGHDQQVSGSSAQKIGFEPITIPAEKPWLSAASFQPIHFSPSQHQTIASPTHVPEWKTKGSDEGQTLVSFNPAHHLTIDALRPQDEVIWIRFVSSALGALLSISAQIYFGAKAGGQTPEAWFWSILLVVSSSILLAYPIKAWSNNWLNVLLCKGLGLLMVVIGYLVMHASIADHTQKSVAAVVAESDEARILRAEIKEISDRIGPVVEQNRRLSEGNYSSKIMFHLSAIKQDIERLAKARDELRAAQSRQTASVSAGVAHEWGLVDLLRRLILEPLNVVCLNVFLNCLPDTNARLRRRLSFL